MGRKYQLENPEDPYDLTDPKGIALELADEAWDDAKDLAGDVADTVSGAASELADDAADEARAAYRDPALYASDTLNRLTRRARARPLDTLATAGAVGFLAGVFWAIARRPDR